jgi:hypothetical protein
MHKKRHVAHPHKKRGKGIGSKIMSTAEKLAPALIPLML